MTLILYYPNGHITTIYSVEDFRCMDDGRLLVNTSWAYNEITYPRPQMFTCKVEGV